MSTLGSPQLSAADAGDALSAMGPGKPLALLTYLAFAPRRTATRDQLCDLLWGDREPEDARALLRQTLWQIKRHELGVAFSATPDGVTLLNDVSIDAWDFAAAVAANELDRALKLYRGEFFPGYAAPGAGRFEQWADLERSRLRALLVHAADSLARHAMNAGHPTEAARIARLLREHDADGEVAWRLLLEALTASGDTVAAHAEADHFEAWLRQEERVPEPLSAAMLRTARRAAPAFVPPPDATLSPDLVGREAEFATLHRAWQDAQGRGARQVHVVAGSGLGKSRLLGDFAARLRASRARVVLLHAHVGGRLIRFSFAADVATALCELPGARGVSVGTAETVVTLNPAVSASFSGVGKAAGTLDARQVGFALLELVAAVSDEGPLALLLDDLHWCDAQSSEVLAILAARLATHRVLLVTTARPGYAIASLPDDTEHLALSPLDIGAVEQMVASIAELPEEPWSHVFASQLLATSGGSPLFALEAIRSCLEERVLALNGRRWVCADPPALSLLLRQTLGLGRRLGTLPPPEGRLLLLLALAAIPVPVELLAIACGETHGQTLERGRHLEQLGFTILTDDGWRIAHDELRDAVLIGAGASEISPGHDALAKAFAGATAADWRQRAFYHFVRAEDWAAAASVIAPYVKRARGQQTPRATIRILGGADLAAEQVERVHRLLPWHVRHPHLRPSLLAAAAVLLLSAGGVAKYATTSPSESVAIAVAWRQPDGDARVRIVPLDRAGWDASRPIVIGKGGLNAHWDRFTGTFHDHFTLRPGSDEWAEHVVSPDSGEGDVYLASSRGLGERLTFARGQDRPSSFSPDGQQLLFFTTRWSARGYSNLAVMDMKTRAVRRLTRSAGTENYGIWSPDGSRIALMRAFPEGDSVHACVTDAGGRSERCARLAVTFQAYWLVGWVDESHLLVSGDSAGVRLQCFFDVEAFTFGISRPASSAVAATDPTARWVLTGGAAGARGWSIAPSDRPDLAKQVIVEGDTGQVDVSFVQSGAISGYLDSIAVDRAHRAMVAGVPHQLRTVARDHAGRPVTAHAVRWNVVSPPAAHIDSLGVLTSPDTGLVIVQVSAGGWRSATDTFAIAAGRVDTLFSESWKGEVFRRWTPFGEPRPVVVEDNGRRAFLNAGEGTFFSGAYARVGTSASAGVALDADVATPLTRPQWQVVIFGLYGLADTTELRRWDHRTGYFPLHASPAACTIAYPNGEGSAVTNAVGLVTDVSDVPRLRHLRLYDGHWWHVRLQWFPDGRCGIAINGVPINIGPGGRPPSGPVHALVQGSTAGTRILVGPLQVFAAVPLDVDWSSLRFRNGYWLP